MTSRYRQGSDFERKVRDLLLAIGAVFVVRSAGSKGPVDLIAFYEKKPVRATHLELPGLADEKTDVTYFGPRQWWEHMPRIQFVQAKRDGHISPADRWALCELAQQCGAVPVLARKGPRGTPVVLQTLEQKAA